MGLSDRRIKYWNRVRLEKQLRSIVQDDELLIAEGNGQRLSEIELSEALWERGL